MNPFVAHRPDADISTWTTPADMVKAAKYLAGQDAKGLTAATVTAEELVRRLELSSTTLIIATPPIPGFDVNRKFNKPAVCGSDNLAFNQPGY